MISNSATCAKKIEINSNPQDGTVALTGSKTYWPIVVVIGVFLFFLSIWLLLDHSTPRWDITCHLVRGHDCATILQSHESLNHKLAKLITLGGFYTPLTYYVHGTLIALLGHSVFVDALPRLFWFSLGCVSLFFVAEKIFKDRTLATLSVAIFSTYPSIIGHTHNAFIDLPMTSMVFASYWCLLEWMDKQTWRNSALFGIVLGLALLSKQTAVLFVVLPLTLLLIFCLRKNLKAARMLIFAGAIASSLFLAWAIPNYSGVHEIFDRVNGNGTSHGSLADGSMNHLLGYLNLVPNMLSFIGVAAFLASLLYFKEQRKLWIPALGAIGGLLALSGVPGLPAVPESRYVMPLAGYAALSTAALLLWLWRGRTAFSKVMVLIFCGCMALQYFSMNFVAEENYRAWGLSALSERLHLSKHVYSPYQDWGNEWVLRTVDKAANHQPSWLIVLPDKRELQVGGLKYLARVLDAQVQPTTWRVFTMGGYEFDYPPEMLKYPNYYLDLEGSKKPDGKKFVDEQAEQRYYNLISLLKTSGDFDRIGTKSLPDGSLLVLYKRRPIEEPTKVSVESAK